MGTGYISAQAGHRNASFGVTYTMAGFVSGEPRSKCRFLEVRPILFKVAWCDMSGASISKNLGLELTDAS